MTNRVLMTKRIRDTEWYRRESERATEASDENAARHSCQRAMLDIIEWSQGFVSMNDQWGEGR